MTARTGRKPGRPLSGVPKLQQFSVRMTFANKLKAEFLAELYGLSLAQAVEQAVSAQYAKVTPEQHAAVEQLRETRAALAQSGVAQP